MSPFSNSSFESSSRPLELSSPPDPPGEKSARQGIGCLYGFCALFALIGAGMFFSLFLRPVGRVVAARNWVAVPCRITSSVVTPHSDSDGTSYSADIVYAYNFGSQNYISGRYSFGTAARGGYSGRQNLVSKYPAGGAATCYVDPSNPGDAVLHRGVSREIWFGLISLPFLGFGVGGLIYAGRVGRDAISPKSGWQMHAAPGDASQALELRPNTSPLARCVGIGLVTLFWNGITGSVAFSVLSQSGIFVGFGALFFVPFVLIGLFLFYGWSQTLLALGNARPKITLARGLLRPGGSVPITVELSGGLFWPQSVILTLEGREEATFSRGTDTITDKSTFYFQELPLSGTVKSGAGTLSIPPGAMHSFESRHNKIVWMLKLRGPIPRWPDIEEEWKIPVEPALPASKPTGVREFS